VSQQAEMPLIGAYMNMALQTIAGRVLAELHTAGFDDIRPAHLTVLRNLWPEGRRISDLADRVGITKASIVYLVDQLQQLGYVEREPDPSDGRATLVRLSERGWSVHQVARAAVQSVQDEWTKVVGTAEMEAFVATLVRLADQSTEAKMNGRSTEQRKTRWRGRRTIGSENPT
jgi:DNA-binding MarR family transcriptional regulator